MFNEAPKTIASFARGYKVRGVMWESKAKLRHLKPALLVLHRQTNLSDVVGKAQHVINRPQVSQSTSLRISFTSCRKAMASAWSQKRKVKKNRFGPPSSRSNPRPYENSGTKGISSTRFTYFAMTCCSCITIVSKAQIHSRTHLNTKRFWRPPNRRYVELWVDRK